MNTNENYQPLSYELFKMLPEKIQSEMIDEVIWGIQFIRGGTFYTPETFRKDLELNNNENFHFHYKIATVGVHEELVFFDFGIYYNDTYQPSEIGDWEGLKLQLN